MRSQLLGQLIVKHSLDRDASKDPIALASLVLRHWWAIVLLWVIYTAWLFWSLAR